MYRFRGVGGVGLPVGLLLRMFSLVLLRVVVLAKRKPTVSILTMCWWFVLGGLLKYFMVFLCFSRMDHWRTYGSKNMLRNGRTLGYARSLASLENFCEP